MRIAMLFMLIAVVVFNFGSMVYAAEAQSATEGKSDQRQEAEAVDVGNKICPVSGEMIGEGTKATYEHEGKTYNFCCSACIDEFKKNPGKYIEKVEEELEGNSMDMGGHMHEDQRH